jgi:hypothetical protein
VKRICRYLPLLFCISFAYGQSAVDVNLGFGTFHDKAPGTGIDSVTGNICNTGSTCQLTPSLGSVFMGFGGSVMLNKRYGFGGEATLQPARQDYSTLYDSTGAAYPLRYRQIFYDFNAIYSPVNVKKAMLRLEGGIGGATTRFSLSSSSCVGTAVCQNQTQPYASSNHFQVHFAAGVQVYVTEHLFIRPQFDMHYVPSYTDQFGSNFVPGAMVYVGYSLGDR